MSAHAEVAAVEAINLAFDGLPDDVHLSVHACQGNYAMGADYDAQIGHRYFDTGRYKADLICKIDCHSYLIEHDMPGHFQRPLTEQELGVCAACVHAPPLATG